MLLGDARREVTSLDGRFLRSLGALMFRPGHLGREWPDGLLARAIGLAPNGIPPWARTASAIILVAYFLRTFKAAYRSRWWHAAIGAVAWVVGLAIANLWFYRTLQFLITFAIT